jgi:regulatory protein
VNLFGGGVFLCGVAYEVVVAESLKVGCVLQPDHVERLRAADERWRAKQAAFSLLAARPRAQGELSDRLRRKGYGTVAIAYAISEAERLELLDDRVFAEAFVRDRVRLRPKGSRALMAELARKRVPADVARTAITRVLDADGVAERSLCLASAQKWARTRSATPMESQDRTALKRKLISFLERRGYNRDDIRHAVDVTLTAAQDAAVAQGSWLDQRASFGE